MPIYRVYVTEETQRRIYKDFDAVSAAAAKQLADDEDWADWAEARSFADQYIDQVEVRGE